MNGCSKACGDSTQRVRFHAVSFFVFMLALFAGTSAQAQEACPRTITADVVALDMPLMFNRLGAQNINGMMYALKRDVVVFDPTDANDDGVADNPYHMKPLTGGVTGSPGKVTLRPKDGVLWAYPTLKPKKPTLKESRPLILVAGAGFEPATFGL